MKNYSSIHTPVQSPSTLSTGELTADILYHHHETLRSIESIIRHPRSLARPTPQWRPPSKVLPPIEIYSGEAPPLTLTISRHRVGERAKARVLGYGEKRVPSLAEAWVRALVPEELVSAVHEISSSSAATFVWLVDSAYTPVHSPLSLFEGFSQAA